MVCKNSIIYGFICFFGAAIVDSAYCGLLQETHGATGFVQRNPSRLFPANSPNGNAANCHISKSGSLAFQVPIAYQVRNKTNIPYSCCPPEVVQQH